MDLNDGEHTCDCSSEYHYRRALSLVQSMSETCTENAERHHDICYQKRALVSCGHHLHRVPAVFSFLCVDASFSRRCPWAKCLCGREEFELQWENQQRQHGPVSGCCICKACPSRTRLMCTSVIYLHTELGGLLRGRLNTEYAPRRAMQHHHVRSLIVQN